MENKKSKYRGVLHVIYTVCGTFGFVAYFAYLLKLMIWPEGTLGYVIAVCGCLVTSIPVVFRRVFIKRLNEKLFLVLESIFAYGMLFYTVTFLALCTYIGFTNSMQVSFDDIPTESAFVVYGAGTRGDKPGNVLRKRLDRAAEGLEAAPDSICVVSGTKGPFEKHTEAYVMKKYLVEEKGIAPERILEEESARNTKENIKYSLECLEENGYGDYNMISVSSSYHIPRIRLICSRTGAGDDFMLAENPTPKWLFSELVREYMAYTKLLITGTE